MQRASLTEQHPQQVLATLGHDDVSVVPHSSPTTTAHMIPSSQSLTDGAALAQQVLATLGHDP
jgi:hypothetical protein